MIPPSVLSADVSSTRTIRAGLSETDISRRMRRDRPRQGSAARFANVRSGLRLGGAWVDAIHGGSGLWVLSLRPAIGTWAGNADTRTDCVPRALGCARRRRRPGTAARAPVDVHLSPVVVDPRRAAHRLRACARGARCRSGRSARPRPSARPGRPTSPGTGRRRRVLPGPQRVDPVPEQHLGPVDVADAGAAPPGPSAGRRSVGGSCRSAPRRRSGRRRAGAGPGPSAAITWSLPLAADQVALAWRRAGRRTPSRSAGAAAPARPAPAPAPDGRRTCRSVPGGRG